MRHSLFLLIITITLSDSINCQTEIEEELKECHKEAEYYFNTGDHEEAEYYYLLLIKHDPDNANFNFKTGVNYLKIPGKETLAIPYLENAVKNVTEKNKYKRKSFEETKAPLHAWFHLGNAYRINNELDKALDAYKTFVNSPYYYGNYNQTIVENEIKSCERASIIQGSPIKLKESLLNDKINTSATELYPVVSGDEKTLVFIRKLKFYDAVFYSRYENGEWLEPVNINPQIISDGDFYPSSLSYDGKELYLIRKTRYGSDIYVSHLKEGLWSEAEKLSGNINTLFDESHVSISEDGESLFICSNKKRGKGGLDIYVSKKDKNNMWSKPKNIGKVINTRYNENTPFITSKGKRLFFSSEGHYNMGGYDIFYSELTGGKWSVPVNMGYPVNNTGDNLFYVPVDGGKVAYTAKFDSINNSNRDIYRFEIFSNLPEVENPDK
jgi:tetratricopeptide (TPR) repeat protein